MFTFAMVTGVKNGWLDANTYGPAARKAWLGLVKYIDKDANVANVCVGTNKWTPDQGDPVQYYLNRPRHAGDLHGQAPILWTASARLLMGIIGEILIHRRNPYLLPVRLKNSSIEKSAALQFRVSKTVSTSA